MADCREKNYKSVCRICHGGCAALLSVKNNKLVKVAPAPGSPFNSGQMCIKGLSTPEIMYHPSRILTPLKRTGERGANQWQKIDWDTALDEIAEKLDFLKQRSGAESIALGQGTGRHHYMHTIRFANTLGTPNWYEPGFANCFIPRITVSNYTYGGFVTADYYGEVQPETILFWGHNPLVSGPDGELSFPAKRALEQGSFGIAIDPRRSKTARSCKMWLPIRPGTDCALALAMLHVIINENFFDKKFVEQRTSGFSELKSHVVNYTPGWASEITGIPVQQIVETARRYAIDTPSILEWGVAIEQTPNSLQTVRAVALLRGLTGNIDIPGADILGMNIVRPYPLLRDKLPLKSARKRIGGEQFKLLSGSAAMLPSAHIPGIFKAMRTGIPYPIKALLNFGSNPLATVANARNVYESLLRLDLLVVADMFMTPTAALADYFLPASFWPEVNQIIELPFIAMNSVTAQKKVVQTGLCRQDEEIMIDLARRLNLPGSEETLEEILDYRLEPLGLTFAQLQEQETVFPPHKYRKFEKNGFHTPSGKIELYSETLGAAGLDPLPVYKEPPESPITQPQTAKKFPCILTTGARKRGYFHSELRQVASLRKLRPNPTAQIHPDTAAKYGIENEQWVFVRSPRGKAKMQAVVTENIKEDVVNVDHAWWYPEKEGPDFGIWDSNANLLTSDQPPYDTAFGTYQLRGLLCRIEKIDAENDRLEPVREDVFSNSKQHFNIARNIEQNCRLSPNKDALHFVGKKLSYQELNAISSRVASGLTQLGICSGERVAVYLPNIPFFITAYFAIQKIGAVAVIVNSALTAREAAYILNDSRSTVFMTTEGLRKRVFGEEFPHLQHILSTESYTGKDIFPINSAADNAQPDFVAKGMLPDDPSSILYTSGTTGFPKGAVISHGNILFDARTTAYMFRLHPDDRVLLFSPLSHSFTLSAGMNACFQVGAAIILHKDFDPETILQSIEEDKITCLFGSTPVYTVLLEKAEPEQMRSVRFYISGGTSMPSELSRKWREKFGRDIYISYGLTECSQCCFNHFLKVKIGSVGTPTEGTDIKIIDENGQELPPDRSGELLVRSPKTISGYWNRQEETAEALRGGWFYTGDIGRKDEDGYIFLTDRKKDMINVGGQSMYPSEVETVLCQHEAVADAAVYGACSLVMGEQVYAAVVLKPGTEKGQAIENELIIHCRLQLADYKMPSRIIFMQELPRAASGKLLKRKLRQQAEEYAIEQIPARKTAAIFSAEEIEGWILEWVTEELQFSLENLKKDNKFSEYGLTSVMTINLMRDLGSRAGQAVDPVTAWHYPTAALLSHYLAEQWNGGSQNKFVEIRPVSRNRDIPLSFVQEDVWNLSKSESSIWNILTQWRIVGRIIPEILEQSLNDLVQRHEILRTTFPVKKGSPVQKIAEELTVHISVTDLRSFQEKNKKKEELIRQEYEAPLDVTKGPVWRVKLLRLTEDNWVFILYIHHIIIDATSQDIFIRELFSLYKSRLSGDEKFSSIPSLPYQYGDFSAWQREFYNQKKLKGILEYYENLLVPAPPYLKLKNDQLDPSEDHVNTFPASFEGFELSYSVTERLNELSRQNGVTLFTILLSALSALLYRYTGCEDLMIGAPTNKRFYRGTEQLIGYFTGQSIIRIDVTGKPDWSTLLERTKNAVQSAVEHQEITYGQIVNAIGKKFVNKVIRSKRPYRVILNYLPQPVNFTVADITIYSEEQKMGESMGRDLTMPIWEEETHDGIFMRGGFKYRTDLFERKIVQQMIKNYKILLNTITTDPSQSVSNVNLDL